MKQFLIATISNDLAPYQSLRDSIAAAGFTDKDCRFVVYDNSDSNRFEPYQVLRDLQSDGDEPYVILCHHDLVFGPETTLQLLQQEIEVLNQLHPQWAVAGCAGMSRRGEVLFFMDDPRGSYRSNGLPRKVISLDESFLLFCRSRFPVPSSDVSGFHFYGTDVAVNATLAGNCAAVIRFPLRHLSGGNVSTPAFAEARRAFERSLRRKLIIGSIRTPCAEIVVSCFPWIERLLQRDMVTRLLRRLNLAFIAKPIR
ncbi:MAG: hypothetical protein JO353_06630 [Phycisphaerae bacterium]|nr:hypothetical protein [Phycisphaerae bacterium]